MDITWFFACFTERNDWWAFLICPAVLVAAGLLFAVFHAKKAYLPLAVFLGGVQLFLVGSSFGDSGNDLHFTVAWAGLYLALCVLVRLLFLIPFRRGAKKDRTAEMYEKFHVGLEVPEEERAPREDVCVGMEESGLHLAHVLSLLEKLRACDLSAGDRLETDAISRTLDAFRGKEMTAEDLIVVNDSLASVLKMTAKYKL